MMAKVIPAVKIRKVMEQSLLHGRPDYKVDVQDTDLQTIMIQWEYNHRMTQNGVLWYISG